MKIKLNTFKNLINFTLSKNIMIFEKNDLFSFSYPTYNEVDELNNDESGEL